MSATTVDGTVVRTLTGTASPTRAARGGLGPARRRRVPGPTRRLRPEPWPARNATAAARTWSRPGDAGRPRRSPPTAPAASAAGRGRLRAGRPGRALRHPTAGTCRSVPAARSTCTVPGVGSVPASGVAAVALSVAAACATADTTLSRPGRPALASRRRRAERRRPARPARRSPSRRSAAAARSASRTPRGRPSSPCTSSATTRPAARGPTRLHVRTAVPPLRLPRRRRGHRCATAPAARHAADHRRRLVVADGRRDRQRLSRFGRRALANWSCTSPGPVRATRCRSPSRGRRRSRPAPSLPCRAAHCGSTYATPTRTWWSTWSAGTRRARSPAATVPGHLAAPHPRHAPGHRGTEGLREAGRHRRRQGRRQGTGAAQVREGRAANLTSSSLKLGAYRTSWPAGLTWPNGSDFYLTKGTNTSNLVIVRVRHKGKKKGKISLRNYAKKTHLVADIVGYYR